MRASNITEKPTECKESDLFFTHPRPHVTVTGCKTDDYCAVALLD